METHALDYVFVAWAYAGVAIVTLALIAWVWWQSRRVKTRLAKLEAQGVRRRSGASAA